MKVLFHLSQSLPNEPIIVMAFSFSLSPILGIILVLAKIIGPADLYRIDCKLGNNFILGV